MSRALHPGDLVLSGNDNLRSLKGLDKLTTVGGDMILNTNMNLRTLDGLGVSGGRRGHGISGGNDRWMVYLNPLYEGGGAWHFGRER